MRFRWLGFALLLASGTGLAQDDGHATDRAYIERSEGEWAETVANHNCSVLERILADDFVGVDVDGSRYAKASSIKDCQSQKSKFASNHANKVDVRFYGDTAIAQGSESWQLKSGKSGKFVWTDTWIRRDGKWEIVAAEDLIPVPSPF
jgi:ketosteroid isomerase-like protein